jgi:RimJ/RimL family protein N-acetyltransferase
LNDRLRGAGEDEQASPGRPEEAAPEWRAGSDDLLGERAEGFQSPPLAGRHVYLRPVLPEDYRNLQRVETISPLGPRWRFRGSTPSPEQWLQSTWDATLVQYLVVGKQRDEPVGLVAIYQANFQDGHALLAATKFDPESRSPLLILGLAMFLDYVFSCWDFRKLYLEVPEYNYPQFASGNNRFFTVEGRLTDHSFMSGQLWDQLILAIHRDMWKERRGGLGGSTDVTGDRRRARRLERASMHAQAHQTR